jgi:hypothetical protein
MKNFAILLFMLAVSTQSFGQQAKIESSLSADQMSGADCGAKINAADTSLGKSPGEIWVAQKCGLAWATAVTVSPGHLLRFVQGNTSSVYSLSAGITMAANSAIMGPPVAMAVNTTPSIVLQMANGANLAALITVNGPNASIRDLELDGNKVNNTSAGPNIIVNSGASRLDIDHVTTGNSNSDGIRFYGTSGAGAAGPKILKLMAYQNNGDGLNCIGSADGIISMSEFETNGQHGIELNDCLAHRIEQSDLGGNMLDGIYVHGSGTGIGANGQIIVGNQFGNNYQNDVRILGTTSGRSVSYFNMIVANSFIGSFHRSSAFASIVLVDGGQNLIASNEIISPSHTRNAYGIDMSETASGLAQSSTVCSNQFVGVFAAAPYRNTQQNMSGCNGAANALYSPNAPTISSGFGSSPSILHNNGTAAFTVNVGGGGAASSGVIGLPTAATGWICNAFDITNPTTGGGYYVKQTAGSRTSATLTGYNTAGAATAWAASDILGVNCFAY